MIRSTHTYALCEISEAAFAEIKTKLADAGYEDQFHIDDEKVVIDMHGIALVSEDGASPRAGRRVIP